MEKAFASYLRDEDVAGNVFLSLLQGQNLLNILNVSSSFSVSSFVLLNNLLIMATLEMNQVG